MDSNFLENITILIIDHVDEDRQHLVKSLSKYFKNIIELNNTQDAIDTYKKHNEIDLIISSINIPEKSGLEFLAFIRESDINLPFIFTTTDSHSENLIQAINLSVSSYLMKPVDINLLLQKIDFLCEKKYYERQLALKSQEISNYIEAVDTVSIIFKMNETGKISYMNSSMQDVSGYKQEDLEELTFNKLIHPEVPKKFIDETWEKIKRGEFWKGNTKFIAKDNSTFYLNNTIFKVNTQVNEFIVIAFLTTEDNLEKRDFHKKVIKAMKDAHIKEYQYKKDIESLQSKLKNQEEFVNNAQNVISALKEKVLQKEKQLTHYELQSENFNKKYDSLINSKKDEIKNYIELLKNEKKRTQNLSQQKEKLEEDLRILTSKYNNLK